MIVEGAMQRAFVVRFEAFVVGVAHTAHPKVISRAVLVLANFSNAVDGIAAVFFIRP